MKDDLRDEILIEPERYELTAAPFYHFEIARRDLELRGPGELLGTRQTGLAQMRVADLLRDADLLPRVQRVAELMLEQHAANIAPLLERWVGRGEAYGQIA